jgi:hypothetical protein
MDTKVEVHDDQTTLGSKAEEKTTEGSKPAEESKKKKARNNPVKEMFDKMYGARNLTQEQLNALKVGDPSPVPKAVVALIKRRIKGSRVRVASIRLRIQEYRKVIRTRRSVDESGHEANLPQSDIDSTRIQLLEARAELMKAQELLGYYEQIFEEALQSQAGQLEKGMRNIRKERAVTRETPQYVKRAMELLERLGSNGEAPEVGGIRSAAKSRDWARFKEPLLGFLATHDKEMSDRLDEIPRLRQKVVAGTMRELKKSG